MLKPNRIAHNPARSVFLAKPESPLFAYRFGLQLSARISLLSGGSRFDSWRGHSLTRILPLRHAPGPRLGLQQLPTSVDETSVSLAVFAGLRARKWAKQTDFSGGALIHEIVVRPAPGRRPGERLLGPSRPLYAPRVMVDGSREDFRLVVDRHGSTFAAVCLRPIDKSEPVEESARLALTRMVERGFEVADEIVRACIAGESAYGYTVSMPRATLTDWKLAHAGWLYVVGTHSQPGRQRHEEAVRRSLDILGTWEWLDPDLGA
jgi:hypothetical protein